ncbi:MAG: hypothetical protein KF861_11260 [Planctomycetaceae bacterium]|nr:hypothetical protein [Planctomycetaceae bacterium]
MLNHDQINDSVRNIFVGNGIAADVVVGRAHRTSPGTKPSGKRLRTAYLATPTTAQPRADMMSAASEPRSQEQWCVRQRPVSSCCMSAGQAPAAIWASLVLAQQSAL